MLILKIRVQLPNLTSNFQTHNKVGDKLWTWIYIGIYITYVLTTYEEIWRTLLIFRPTHPTKFKKACGRLCFWNLKILCYALCYGLCYGLCYALGVNKLALTPGTPWLENRRLEHSTCKTRHSTCKTRYSTCKTRQSTCKTSWRIVPPWARGIMTL